MTPSIGARSNMFFLCGVSIAVVCLSLAIVGCQPGDTTKPKDKGSTPKGESSSKEEAKTDKPGDGDKATPKDSSKQMTGREVLAKMLEAYRNASSYSDMGTAKISITVAGQGKDAPPQEEKTKFSVAYVRPNKVRIQAYNAEVICDGTKLYGYVPYLPDQVLVRPAPERMTIRGAQPDRLIADVQNQGFTNMLLPQIAFLFGNARLETLLQDVENQEMLKPGVLDGRNCYRVKMSGPDGVATFWIDEETYVLRRILPPTDALRQLLSQDAPIENLSLVIDFTGAQLNGNVDPKAFQFEMPEGAKAVDFLTPPDMRQLLNQKVPELKTVDLAGKAISADDSAGKTSVLVFWSVKFPACHPILKALDEMAKKHKNDPKLAFRAICIDPEKYVTRDDIEKFAADLGINMPIERYSDKSVMDAFRLGEPPDTFIVNDKGIVQHCECGRNPKYTETLQAKLAKVLAGEDIYQEPLKQYEEAVKYLKNYANETEPAPGEPNGKGQVLRQDVIPEVKVAAQTRPTSLKLSPLWKSADLKNPGNILVVSEKAGPERVFVIENATSVVELGLDGKALATHDLGLERGEIVSSLRTAVGADGRRYFVVLMFWQQRCHVYDENWKLVAHYPDDALKNPHDGISDVRIGDLDGDGKLKLYVSYLGVVGVQAVSLDGHRLWKNRADVSSVGCLAIGAPNADRRRDLFCAASTGIAVLDAQGQRRGEVKVPNRLFNCILNADLQGDGSSSWCGLASVNPGEDATAVGFTPNGDELWSYALPPGVQPRPIERIVVGRLTPKGPSQWILPGPDGSIHALSSDGTLLDKFNYGARLQGLATVQIDGRPVLLVATEKGLEAWKVE